MLEEVLGAEQHHTGARMPRSALSTRSASSIAISARLVTSIDTAQSDERASVDECVEAERVRRPEDSRT